MKTDSSEIVLLATIHMSHNSTENPFPFFEFGASRRRTGGGGEGLARLRGYEARSHALTAWPKGAHGLLAMEAGDNSGCCLWWPS